jgi:L-threonylcarbamoyladenylate synthase
MRIVQQSPGSATNLEPIRKSLERGELVLVPTDTVYGIAALAADESAVRRLYAAKGRPETQQTAAIFSSIAAVVDTFPDLDVRTSWAMHALFPGPWTLVIDNPTGRWPWLTGGVPGPIGIRVPAGALDLPPIAATSANRSGEPTASRVHEIDRTLHAQLSYGVDRGALPAGNESTVLDLVTWARGAGDIIVLRDTVGRAGQARAVLADGP